MRSGLDDRIRRLMSVRSQASREQATHSALPCLVHYRGSASLWGALPAHHTPLMPNGAWPTKLRCGSGSEECSPFGSLYITILRGGRRGQCLIPHCGTNFTSIILTLQEQVSLAICLVPEPTCRRPPGRCSGSVSRSSQACVSLRSWSKRPNLIPEEN